MKRITSVLLASLLILSLGVVSVYGKTASDSTPPPKNPETSAESARSTAESKRNEKVRADMAKLVSDAKAGKVAPKPQHLPTTRNNLSTGAKIGIAAAIGGAIFLIIMLRALNSDDD
jgi:hypothetical protein